MGLRERYRLRKQMVEAEWSSVSHEDVVKFFLMMMFCFAVLIAGVTFSLALSAVFVVLVVCGAMRSPPRPGMRRRLALSAGSALMLLFGMSLALVVTSARKSETVYASLSGENLKEFFPEYAMEAQRFSDDYKADNVSATVIDMSRRPMTSMMHRDSIFHGLFSATSGLMGSFMYGSSLYTKSNFTNSTISAAYADYVVIMRSRSGLPHEPRVMDFDAFRGDVSGGDLEKKITQLMFMQELPIRTVVCYVKESGDVLYATSSPAGTGVDVSGMPGYGLITSACADYVKRHQETSGT